MQFYWFKFSKHIPIQRYALLGGRGKLTTDAHSVELKVGNNNKAPAPLQGSTAANGLKIGVCVLGGGGLGLCVYLYVSVCVYVRSSIPGFSAELGQTLSMTLEHRR